MDIRKSIAPWLFISWEKTVYIVKLFDPAAAVALIAVTAALGYVFGFSRNNPELTGSVIS